MSRAREAEPLTGGGVLPLLRRAAAALRGQVDRPALAACLNEFLQLAPVLRATWVELPATAPSGDGAGTDVDRFSSQALTLPLRAGAEVAGVLRHRLDGLPLDRERLRLLGAVADLLGAILEQTGRAVGGGAARTLLDQVLEHTPFGVVCLSPSGAVLAANQAARAFAEADDALARLVLVPVAPVGERAGPTAHVARSGDHSVLVHVHAGPASADGGAPGIVALLLDLGQQARAFLGAVARETYRALWLGRPLSLAVLAAADRARELMDAADAVCGQLPPGAETGPLEPGAYAILAPETNQATLRAWIRSNAAVARVPGLRVGVAELRREHRSPEAFITAAVGVLAPADQLRRPAVLLCDTSPSVTEALQVALRIDCDSVRCHDHAAGFHLLGERPFDAIFAKVELDEWDADIEFLRRVLELQPALKPFIVTDAAGLYSATIPELPAGTPVFRKPFQVAAVRHAVRAQFAGGEAQT